MTFENFQNSREIQSEKENIVAEVPAVAEKMPTGTSSFFAEYLTDCDDEFDFDIIVTISC
jgi:hypothetical protein